jgi:hypothetical protein
MQRQRRRLNRVSARQSSILKKKKKGKYIQKLQQENTRIDLVDLPDH